MKNDARKYKEFKLEWMLDHGYTLEDLISVLASIQEETGAELVEVFSDFEEEFGFNSDIYPSYDEWLDNDRGWKEKIMDEKLRKLLDKYGVGIEMVERKVINYYFLQNSDIKFPFDIPNDYEDRLSEAYYDDAEYLFNIYVDGELSLRNITEEELNTFFKDLIEGRKIIIKEEE